jgi:hypothetical protein
MDERVKNIMAEALQMSNPGTRRAWLERACAGDDEVRREVKSLLKAYEQAGDALDHAMLLPAPDDVEFACPDIRRLALRSDLDRRREGRGILGMLTWSFWVHPSVFDMLAGASPASAMDGWAE